MNQQLEDLTKTVVNPTDWHVRIYWLHSGFHTHCRVFTGPHPQGGSSGNAFIGHLTLSVNEWEKFKAAMPNVIFIHEPDNGVFNNELGYTL